MPGVSQQIWRLNMTALNCFRLSHDGAVAHLVLSRPEAFNTMQPAFWRQLHDILSDLTCV